IYPFVTFADFEEQLRLIESPMYLIALPALFAPPDLEVGLPNPNTKKIEKLGHYLFVALHGAIEARDVLAEYGLVGGAANLDKLRFDTGVLVKKSITRH